jgi:hypothetical protein
MNEITYNDGLINTLALPAPPPSWRSPEIGALAAALAKAQAVIENATREATAQVGGGEKARKYKYADLAAVLDEARKALSANGLAVTQLTSTRATADLVLAIVETVLLHESGQWIRSELSMPVEGPTNSDGRRVLAGAQEVGIAITYARRYALAAIVGISQEDSDGAVAAPPPDPRPVEKRPALKNSERPATDAQIGKVRALAREVFPELGGEKQAEALKILAIDMALPASSKDYTAADASRLIDRLTGIKDGHDKVPF